jgi:hypothetical protein
MPAAAQAAVLPLMLSCTEPTKMIQLVDLRPSELPPSDPPAWLKPLPLSPDEGLRSGPSQHSRANTATGPAKTSGRVGRVALH